MIEKETDLTVHLWENCVRVVIFREWSLDTALIARIDYGPEFGDELRDLFHQVESTLGIVPDPRSAIESMIIE